MARLPVAIVCLIGGWAPTAHAQDAPERVMVTRVVEGGDPATARAVADAVAARLRARGLPVRTPVPPPEPEPEPVHPAIARAAQAYAHLRPDEAFEQSGTTLEALDRAGGRGLARSELLGLLLLRAMAAQAIGHDEAVDGALDRALAIDPALAPDPAAYPPSVRDRLAARRDARDEARHRLSIEDLPADARVWVDAEPAPPGPWTLAPGTHLLAVEAAGRSDWARRVELDGDRSLLFDAPIDPERILVAPADRSIAQLARAARALGERLVLLDVRGHRVSLWDQSSRRSAEVALDGEAGAEVLAERLLSALAPPVLPATPGRDAAEGPDVLPWVVAGSTLLIIGGVVAAMLLLSSADPEPPGGTWWR